MRRGSAWLVLTLSGGALACSQPQIESATALVLQSNPMLLAERYELAEQSRQRDWNAQLTLAYAVAQTESSDAMPNAAVQVVIPLFDRARELQVVKARSALQQRQDAVLNDFLKDIERLCAQADQVRAFDTMRGFYRDRLQYRQEQVNEGLAEAESLWQETEKVQQAEHDYRRGRGELAAMQLAIARRTGGEQWKHLQALLAAATR